MYVGRWRHPDLRFVARFVVKAHSVDNKTSLFFRSGSPAHGDPTASEPEARFIDITSVYEGQ